MKTRWLASAGAGCVAMAAMVLLFRTPTVRAPAGRVSAVAPATAASPIRLDRGRTEEVTMRDLEPLFLPTPFNAAPAALPAKEPGHALLDRDELKPKFSEDDPALTMPLPVTVPATPLAALDGPENLGFGFGRTDATVVPAAEHAAYLEVVAAQTGLSVLRTRLGAEARPPTAAPGAPGWQPLEFLAAVDASGLVGSLSLTSGSGREDVDNFFRNYLARTFRVGDRLPPGFYRIVVGP